MNKLPLIFIASLTLIGCQVTQIPELGPLDDLENIENLTQDSISSEKKETQIRYDMLKESALSVGARGGLAARTEQLNADLAAESEQLTRVFNFQGLMLENNVQPPVLVEGRDALNLDSPYSIRIADRNYRIVKQARFVTTIPVWQDYLIIPVKQPEAPDKSLLPKEDDEDEIALWHEYTRIGWQEGIEQADAIYAENLARLKRDYTGMIRYRKLLAQNMVSAPLVSEKELGITGGGEQLAINDRVLTIKALPSLKANSEQWEPVITDE
ncbi:MAG: type IV secretory system conjugative DNA transfer family protein [Gammaproteobacteria bacterium]